MAGSDPDGTTQTTRVHLAYGEGGLSVELPAARTTVVEPVYTAGAADQRGVLRHALRQPVAGPPLRELARRGQKVAISMCDGTRAQPRHLMIPAVLEELDGIIDLDDVVILVATGTPGATPRPRSGPCSATPSSTPCTCSTTTPASPPPWWTSAATATASRSG